MCWGLNIDPEIRGANTATMGPKVKLNLWIVCGGHFMRGTVPNQIGRLAYPPLAAEDAEIKPTPKLNP